jgi:hypothetical protein
MSHQTKLTAKAVRQHGRLSTIMANHNNPAQAPASDDGRSLCQKLMQRLAAVVPDSDTITKTTGVDRYVRHAGSYGGSGAPPNARAQNKATVQNVAASVHFIFIHHSPRKLLMYLTEICNSPRTHICQVSMGSREHASRKHLPNQSPAAWAFFRGLEAWCFGWSGFMQRFVYRVSLPP